MEEQWSGDISFIITFHLPSSLLIYIALCESAT